PAPPECEFDFGTYVVHSGSRSNPAEADLFAGSPVRPLYRADKLAAAVLKLKQAFKADDSPQLRVALQTEAAPAIDRFRGHWFQRIPYPAHHLTSTSDHSMAWIDEGGLNTLGNRLSSAEASVLRPWPKWSYIEPLLPDLRGKSVLELGSSNGFFCFQFAAKG